MQSKRKPTNLHIVSQQQICPFSQKMSAKSDFLSWDDSDLNLDFLNN